MAEPTTNRSLNETIIAEMWKRDVAPLVPFFVIGIISGVFTTWVERRFVGTVGSEFTFTFVERCLIAGRTVWFYLYKLLWPAKLILIYPRWHVDVAAAAVRNAVIGFFSC